MSANLENSAVATRLEKDSFYPNPKEGQSQRIFTLLYKSALSHATKVMGKILGFSTVRTENFHVYKLGLEKEEEPVTKLSTFIASWRNKGILGKKKSTSASLTMLKPLTG